MKDGRGCASSREELATKRKLDILHFAYDTNFRMLVLLSSH